MLGKTLDILASSIIYKYDINKTQNIIRKISLFHTPASRFLQNGHDTMGEFAEKKLAKTDSFHILGCSFFAHPLPELLTKQNIKKTYSRGNIWGPFYTPKDEASGGG